MWKWLNKPLSWRGKIIYHRPLVTYGVICPVVFILAFVLGHFYGTGH